MTIIGTIGDGVQHIPYEVERWPEGDWLRAGRNIYPVEMLLAGDIKNKPNKANGYTTGLSLTEAERLELARIVGEGA